jgi:hypothetical protein
MKLSKLKLNPTNPRIIKDEKFKKLDPTLVIKKNGKML